MWTEDEKRKMIKMAAQGYSTTQMGKALGRTRNSIIGFAHRNKIDLNYRKSDHVHSRAQAADERRLNVEKREAKSERKGPLNWNRIKKKDPKPPTFVAAEVTARDPKKTVTFMELTHFHCKAIIGPVNGINTVYCGQIVKFGKSWCEHHHKKFFYPAIERAKNVAEKTFERNNRNF